MEDASMAQLHSSIQVNEHLQSYSLPPLLLDSTVDAGSASSAVRCIHSLLLLRQQEINDREEISGCIRRAKGDIDRLHRQIKRHEEQTEKAQAAFASVRKTHAAKEQEQRQQREALQNTLNDLQHTRTQLLYRESHLIQRSANQEKECKRFSDLMNSMLRDKDMSMAAPGIQLLNGAFNGAKGLQLAGSDPLSCIQRRVADSSESSLEDCQDELQTLRSALGAFHHQFASLMSRYYGCAPDPSSDELPFFMTPEAIEDYFRSNEKVLEEALHGNHPLQVDKTPLPGALSAFDFMDRDTG